MDGRRFDVIARGAGDARRSRRGALGAIAGGVAAIAGGLAGREQAATARRRGRKRCPAYRTIDGACCPIGRTFTDCETCPHGNTGRDARECTSYVCPHPDEAFCCGDKTVVPSFCCPADRMCGGTCCRFDEACGADGECACGTSRCTGNQRCMAGACCDRWRVCGATCCRPNEWCVDGRCEPCGFDCPAGGGPGSGNYRWVTGR